MQQGQLVARKLAKYVRGLHQGYRTGLVIACKINALLKLQLCLNIVKIDSTITLSVSVSIA